ncbi:Protein of unknown function (DUF2927) [Hasllibacter halocynthiae]|uniref:DUF2927 family protein n=1 Tax=Hasllibacter halocynthiae TaxID=595589 RepID=A0A2T0X7G7_9RHOB|nr:DUF2927 domain-containing protein [Hasllibacter halocynthiae]PRY94876.1 Protein of unknown function (DUF2927) [Hasllibacter halocynthiae]
MIRPAALLVSTLLAACAPAPETTRAVPMHLALPAMQTFGPSAPGPLRRSNATIARDFLDLHFALESGRTLPRLTRFEGPVTLRLVGAPPHLAGEADLLTRRLRDEADVDIRLDTAGDRTITVQILPGHVVRRIVPTAACFVAPRASSWAEYEAGRRAGTTDWAALAERRHVVVFIPSDLPPQEQRDCLHEEVAQALGPLNDLWHLADSVFNDDNFHAVLTSFDMLVLRMTYAPELRSGMSREVAAAALPRILARLNPRGGSVDLTNPATDTRWSALMAAALGPGQARVRRERAVRAAEEARRFPDTRRAFALYVYGRLSLSVDGSAALAAFLQAGEIYARADLPVQSAHVAVQMAAFALSAGRPRTAIAIARQHRPAADAAQNASVLASLGLIEAEALKLLGRTAEAEALRVDSLGWARYGFGSGTALAARVAEIRGLAPR